MMDVIMDTSNSLAVAAFFVFEVSTIMMAFCGAILLHLSYYIIAHLIELLAISISSKESTANKRYYIDNVKQHEGLF